MQFPRMEDLELLSHRELLRRNFKSLPQKLRQSKDGALLRSLLQAEHLEQCLSCKHSKDVLSNSPIRSKGRKIK